MTTRTRGPVPEYAKSITQLIKYLMPPRDRKIIQRAQKLPGCPTRQPQGFHINTWEAFVNEHFESRAPLNAPGTPNDKRLLEEEKLRLTNERLRFQLKCMQAEYSKNTDIMRNVGDMVTQARHVLQGLVNKLPPVLVGLVSEVEIQRILAFEINECLQHLTKNPLGPATQLPTGPEQTIVSEEPPPTTDNNLPEEGPTSNPLTPA